MTARTLRLLRYDTVYVVTVISAGIAVSVHSVRDLVAQPVGIEWFILVLLTLSSGWATLRIPEMPISFSISDTFIYAAALLFGPSAGAMTAALDALVLSSRMAFSRRTLHRVLFNSATTSIAVWLAAQAFFTLAGSQPLLEGRFAAVRLLGLLAVFGTIAFALNTGIVATAVSFERKQPVFTVWREHFLGLWVSYFGGVFGAMLLLILTLVHRFDVLVLILPLPLILYMTFRHALGRAQDQIAHLGKVNRMYVATIEALAHAVDAKDQVTHDHVRRVQDEAVRLARALEVRDENELQAIRAASLLHDIGKLAIPEHILNKPGELTAAELEIMKRHAAIGADILSVVGFPYAVAPIVRHHHESWNGTGYPDGLTGDSIPIGARILAVVDCFDALISDRPYRPRLSDADALQILARRRGTMYDPRVVDSFFALHRAETDPPSEEPITATPPLASAPAGPRGNEGEDGRRDSRDVELVADLERVFGSSASPGSLGEMLWARLKPRLPASAFVLYAYDAAEDTLVATYVSDPVATAWPCRIRVGERLSGWVAATGQTILNSDARLDLDIVGRERSPLRSALAVRIGSNGHTRGVLSFYASEPNAFEMKHKQLIEATAEMVAAAGLLLADHEAAPSMEEVGMSD